MPLLRDQLNNNSRVHADTRLTMHLDQFVRHASQVPTHGLLPCRVPLTIPNSDISIRCSNPQSSRLSYHLHYTCGEHIVPILSRGDRPSGVI